MCFKRVMSFGASAAIFDCGLRNCNSRVHLLSRFFVSRASNKPFAAVPKGFDAFALHRSSKWLRIRVTQLCTSKRVAEFASENLKQKKISGGDWANRWQGCNPQKFGSLARRSPMPPNHRHVAHGCDWTQKPRRSCFSIEASVELQKSLSSNCAKSSQ